MTLWAVEFIVVSLVAFPSHFFLTISTQKMISMKSNFGPGSFSFCCHNLSSNDCLSTTTTNSAIFSKIMMLTEKVTFFGRVKFSIQWTLAFKTDEATFRMVGFVESVHGLSNNGFSTGPTSRTETGLPASRAVRKTINTFTDSGRIFAKIFLAHVAEQVIQMPHHLEGFQVIHSRRDEFATSATSSRVVVKHQRLHQLLARVARCPSTKTAHLNGSLGGMFISPQIFHMHVSG